jgi:hypothetical protein
VVGEKMKKLIISIVLALVFVAGYAIAQSTANQIVLGYNTTSGNYWLPYTISNPLPTESH